MSDTNKEKLGITTIKSLTEPSSIESVDASGCSHRPPPPSYEESQRTYGTSSGRVAHAFITNSPMSPYSYNTSQHKLSTPSYRPSAAVPPPRYHQQHYVSATSPVKLCNIQVGKESQVQSLAAIRTPPTGVTSIPAPQPVCTTIPAQYPSTWPTCIIKEN